MNSQLVKLTYFKPRGKYHGEGELHVDTSLELFHIWDHVERLRSDGRLPGLVKGAGKEYIISIDAPGHRHEHPRLLML